jgi:hypothetical protein
VHELLFEEMAAVLDERGRGDTIARQYLEQLKIYSRCRKMDVIDHDLQLRQVFHFDFEEIAERNFEVDPKSYRSSAPREYRFAHSSKQAELIDGYVSQYGKTLDGLGRILMRAWPTKRLFREATHVS